MKRCYASYIVNTDYIEWWSGSSAKMKLCLKGYHHTIPVSDTYTASFKELMNERGIVKKEGKS
jgi:DNA-binding LytR/AlgR family response regulator